MRASSLRKIFIIIFFLSFGMIFGCLKTKSEIIKVQDKTELELFIPKVFQEIDGAIEEARQAGKDIECPEDFSEVLRLRNLAYKRYWDCRHCEWHKQVKDAREKLEALCPLPKALFVLLPDPDGTVGKMSITSPVGSQVLDEAYLSTGLDRPDEIPSTPKKMTKEQVQRIFGAALGALPEAPVIFTLYFKIGSTGPTEESLRELPKIVEAIKARHAIDISVIGHTDRIGAADFNRKLSLKRAARVAEMLISHGINRDIIDVVSHGEHNLQITTPDNVSEAKNRRVEIHVR